LSDLKLQYPNLKTFISIGGWTIWKEGPPAAKFSKLCADSKLRAEFISSVIEFCIKYNFDGIDIDYEYPGFVKNGGNPEPDFDKNNFTLLLKEFDEIIKNKDVLRVFYVQAGKEPKDELLLTIAAPAGPSHMANIDFEKIIAYVDWINVMAYDFHGVMVWTGRCGD
jgi:chitinase